MDRLVGRLRDRQALAKLIGESPSFVKVIRQLPAVAKSDVTVLLTGETGTGKELVARSLHYLSERAAFPFVAVNCGSIPDSLLEDELFGHERGAFTDAHAQRRGVIPQAQGGSLFLDEIDALSPKGQVSLLRVLQDKRFRPIGSSQEQQADVRVVAATNASLEELVRSGAFRADLYYRLCVFSLHLPPLRKRRDDIVPLAYHFLKTHVPADEPMLTLAPAACQALLMYDWPGNVRELENVIIRAIHLGPRDGSQIVDLGIPQRSVGSSDAGSPGSSMLSTLKARKTRVVAAFERDYLTHLMQEHCGNVSRAALAAGKERRDFGRLLKKYQIDPKSFYLRAK